MPARCIIPSDNWYRVTLQSILGKEPTIIMPSNVRLSVPWCQVNKDVNKAGLFQFYRRIDFSLGPLFFFFLANWTYPKV